MLAMWRGFRIIFIYELVGMKKAETVDSFKVLSQLLSNETQKERTS
jgi:hypothetical protein